MMNYNSQVLFHFYYVMQLYITIFIFFIRADLLEVLLVWKKLFPTGEEVFFLG